MTVPGRAGDLAPELDRAVLWHEVECAAYSADLALWERLADRQGCTVLELGSGIGRVTLTLARAGARVSGLDSSDALVAELRRRAAADGLSVDAWIADARSFELGRRFDLIIAPMQLAHLLGGRSGRRSMLACAARHLEPNGQLALALLAGDATSAVGVPPPVPDVLERDGWIYSSLPIESRQVAGGIEVRRLRQAVSPGGKLTEELDVTTLEIVTPEQLEGEALDCGLCPAGRHEVPATPDHVGSTVVVLEVS
jgi:SAM-dependent methyltransferase